MLGKASKWLNFRLLIQVGDVPVSASCISPRKQGSRGHMYDPKWRIPSILAPKGILDIKTIIQNFEINEVKVVSFSFF